MAKRKKKSAQKSFNIMNNLRDETRHWVLSILFFVLAIFFILASFNSAGVVGSSLFNWLEILLGIGYFILPLLFILLGISFFKGSGPNFAAATTTGAIFFLLSGLGVVSTLAGEELGGFIGKTVSTPLVTLFDFWITFIFLFAIFIISISIIFDAKPTLKSFFLFTKLFRKREEVIEEAEFEDEEEDGKYEEEEQSEENEVGDEEEIEKVSKVGKIKNVFGINTKKEEFSADYVGNAKYSPPPLSLLAGDKGKPGVGDIKINANIIKRTLQNFGINVEMDEISIGPSVTRYALKPAEGVKLSRIVGLQNDLSLALAAHPLRIEAPIPGKSLVGIEIPNNIKTIVGFGTLLSSNEYQNSNKPLPLSLGKGISGNAHFADLAKMPHLLIAGATGSGKSVVIHTIINSLLFKKPPENLRFIMIDPKRVELTLYNKIPHLLTPVITDAKKAILALKWAAKEMDRRYDILEAESVRDIASYHKNILAPALKEQEKREKDDEEPTLPEKMPYIVIVIDELADIMTAYPRELESAIVRLAQMSRAVGIHLILSTQRPSVNIITGLIKANIPARVALQVASQIDSRTILDAGGAEKLLGAGDMLYMSGEMSKPVRLQSAFVSEAEVKKIVKYLANEYKDEVPEEIAFSEESGRNTIFEATLDDDEDDEDEFYEEARNLVIEAKKASASYLQRKLRVGYARAARLLDILEDRGVIGPSDGSKAREVYEINEGYGESDEEERE